MGAVKDPQVALMILVLILLYETVREIPDPTDACSNYKISIMAVINHQL
jgi:hypothetical protein